MTDKPTITQADRDAAYNFNLYETAASILGDGEIRRLASYFAKHRIQSIADLQAKLDRAVAALEEVIKSSDQSGIPGYRQCWECADTNNISKQALAAIEGAKNDQRTNRKAGGA